VEIKDNAYGAKPVTRGLDLAQATTIVLPLERSHGWYDYTVKATGSDAEARFAGRVETGKPTYTDPLMGGTV
jgi:phospholipase C